MSGHHTSLLQRYNLHIDQLDYGYVRECSDVATLERIIKVLKSGQEGCYPHLLQYCEDRLRQLHPDSRLLLTPQSPTHLHSKQLADLKAELCNWGEEMKLVEERAAITTIKPPLPPVRTVTVIGRQGSSRGQMNQTQIDDILALGWQHVEAGDMLQASLQFQKVLAINPRHTEALRGMEGVQGQNERKQSNPKEDKQRGPLIEELE